MSGHGLGRSRSNAHDGQTIYLNVFSKPFDLTLPAISKHLKVLEHAGLIVRGRHAQYRPCSLDASRLGEVSSWTEQYRPIWEARFDRMDGHIKQLQPPRKTGKRNG